MQMSLDKAIAHGKEHRKPYRGAKAIDHSCRNHGNCPYCQGKRKYKAKKQEGEHEQLAEEEGEEMIICPNCKKVIKNISKMFEIPESPFPEDTQSDQDYMDEIREIYENSHDPAEPPA
jgi:hypothetical protein